jgi:hypothetical protein
MPGDMNPREREAWHILSGHIDMESMQRDVPKQLRQIGVIREVTSNGVRVLWEDGTKEGLALEFVPAEVAGFSKGDRFEAIVSRDRTSFALIEIVHARLIAHPPEMSDKEADDLWKSLPSTSELGEGNWESASPG